MQNGAAHPSRGPFESRGRSMLKSRTGQRVLRRMQRWSAGILGCVLLLNGAVAAAIDFSKQQRFHIPPQALSDALVQFSAQAGLQFTAPGAGTSQAHSGGVSGEYRPDAALRVLLQGTGFTFHIVDEGTVAITALP